MAESDIKTCISGAVVKTRFIVIRVGVCSWTIAMNQLNVLGLNNDSCPTLFWWDWWGWTAKVVPRGDGFGETLSERTWIVPLFARWQAHDGASIFSHSQVLDIGFVCWTRTQFQVTVSSFASALNFAGDDFHWQRVAVNQADVIPNVAFAVDWREEKFNFGLCRWVTSSCGARIDWLSDFAVLTVWVAALFRPKATSPVG